jgi:hypothetical protein
MIQAENALITDKKSFMLLTPGGYFELMLNDALSSDSSLETIL